jgi:hypothetical protein
MTVILKLAGFLTVLVAVFGVSYLTGTQSQTLLAPAPTHGTGFGGLSATTDGYTVTVREPNQPPGADRTVEFAVTGPDGQAVRAYDETDGARLHLVAVRGDLAGYQHLYPQQGDDGSWRATLDLTPGPWRFLLELQPTRLGRAITLGTDLSVSGSYHPQPLPGPTNQADVDGLTVALTRGAGSDAHGGESTIRVTRAGEPVTDLQVAHGALAHGVLIRPSDLGYLHLHAVPATSTGPLVLFLGGPTQPGTYRLFVDFTRQDTTFVAPFTIEVTR